MQVAAGHAMNPKIGFSHTPYTVSSIIMQRHSAACWSAAPFTHQNRDDYTSTKPTKHCCTPAGLSIDSPCEAWHRLAGLY